MAEYDLDALAYLQAKGIPYKVASHTNVNTPCWWHGQNQAERGKLYINISDDPTTNGLYMCHKCGEKGNLLTLMRYFGDTPPKTDKWDGSNYVRQQILQSAAAYYHANLEVEHVKWLRDERGLTPATIQKFQLGWAGGGLYKHLSNEGFELKDMVKTGLIAIQGDSSLQADGTFLLGSGAHPYDFLRDCITIPYMVAGNCVMIRGKKIGGKYLTPPRQESRLFNTDVVWNTDVCAITEGEFDAMVVEQMGYSAVGSPGAKMWQDSWDSYFEEMKRVYVIFDNDAAGQTGADAIKDRLGRKARSVLMPDGGLPPGDNDISEWFGKQKHDRDEFAELLRKADRAGTLLVNSEEAYQEWLEIQGAEALKYGFEEFDDYMKPGHIPGQVWVVLAKTNVGKTLFLLNVFQNLSMVEGQENKKILFVSLEQSRGDWFERARRIWNFWNLDCPAPDVNQETINYWRDRIRLTDVNRMSTDSLIGAIDDFTEELGQPPDLVAIDYLGYWARSFKAVSKYEQVTEAIMSLKEVGKERMVPVLAPHQVSRTQDFGKELEVDSGRDSGAVEETADGVYLLWNPDNAVGKEVEDRTGRVNLKIGKTRHGSKGRVAAFQFGYLSLALAPMSNLERVRMLTDEIDYDNRDDMAHVVDKWEAAMYRHRTGMRIGDISEALLKERA